MTGEKIFIGPKIREMRLSRNLTQAEMAAAVGVSTSYVNLIERNQRSASVNFLIALSDAFGINWRQLTKVDSSLALSDLREITNDPAFGDVRPDIEELRALLDGAPNVARGLSNMYRVYRNYGERLATQSEALATPDEGPLAVEEVVLQFFRENNNYFDAVERLAEKLRPTGAIDREELYGFLKTYLAQNHTIAVSVVPSESIGSGLRYVDREQSRIFLSEGLDYTNKVFQLAHTIALIEHSDAIGAEIKQARIVSKHAAARCRVELANYFAAAVMMPYDEFFDEAVSSKYDIDNLATRFATSYEQACHRLTTLQRPGKKAIPLFLLRIDRAGNVTKRFNATPMPLARFGGTCPKLDVHYCFQVSGRIITQVIEMPDNSRYLAISRTVDRPSLRFNRADNRLALSIGCSIEDAPATIYGETIDLYSPSGVTEVGVNCRLCPRRQCAQRANEPFFENLRIDENRRGVTRFES